MCHDLWGETGGREPLGERLREAGVFSRWEAGDHVDKTVKKYIIHNNFNIIMLFDLHIASKYTNDTNALAKIRL